MEKVNILFVALNSHIAGGEINLISLLNTLSDKSIVPYFMYNPSSGGNAYIKNEEVKFIPIKMPKYSKGSFLLLIKTGMQIAYFLKKYNIKLIYFNGIRPLKLFSLLLRIFRVKSIAHIHADENDKTLRWLNVNSVDRILFCSKYTMETIFKHSSWINGKKGFFVHNAVDLSFYYPRDTGRLKEELSLDEKFPVIGIIGQVKQIKGQHLFLEMVKKLNDNNIRAEFLIVGDDNVQKGKYLKKLNDRAAELNVKNLIHWVGYRKDVPQIMSLCDLIVVPSLKEPFGRVVIESMACGTPVVASKVGGMQEIFVDGHGGLYCESDNADSLTEKVMCFFNDKEWWKKQKKAALEFCRNNYSQKKHTVEIEKSIAEVLNAKG